MLERVQQRSWLQTLIPEHGARLHGAQKALAQWAIVDDYQTVLDLSCRDVRLLRHLSQKFSLRACGIAERTDIARQLREQAPDAEIFCARKEDIPWSSEAFDAVFYQMKEETPAFDPAFINEAARVLRPGGQLLIALTGLPEALCRALTLAGLREADEHVAPCRLLRAMEDAGLSDVSFRRTQPLVGLAMGWKRAPEED